MDATDTVSGILQKIKNAYKSLKRSGSKSQRCSALLLRQEREMADEVGKVGAAGGISVVD